VVFLRKELRLPKSDKTYYGLDELTKEFLQNKLERLEDKDPPLAAEIDRWRTQKDLPDMYL
jgi:hypothetical protein